MGKAANELPPGVVAVYQVMSPHRLDGKLKITNHGYYFDQEMAEKAASVFYAKVQKRYAIKLNGVWYIIKITPTQISGAK